MTRQIVARTVITVALLCWGWIASAGSVQMSLGRDALQAYVDEFFPLIGQEPLITVTMSDPEVVLKKGGDRVGIRVQLQVVFGQDLAIGGAAMIDGRPRLDRKTRALYLDDANLKELAVGSLAPSVVHEIQLIGSDLVRRSLSQWPVYRFDGEKNTPIAIDQLRGVHVNDGRLVFDVAAFN